MTVPDQFEVSVTCPNCQYKGLYSVNKEDWETPDKMLVWTRRAQHAHLLFADKHCMVDPNQLVVKVINQRGYISVN